MRFCDVSSPADSRVSSSTNFSNVIGIAFARTKDAAFEANFDRGFHSDQPEMFRMSESQYFRGIPDGIHDVVLVVVDSFQNPLGQYRRAKSLP